MKNSVKTRPAFRYVGYCKQDSLMHKSVQGSFVPMDESVVSSISASEPLSNVLLAGACFASEEQAGEL